MVIFQHSSPVFLINKKNYKREGDRKTETTILAYISSFHLKKPKMPMKLFLNNAYMLFGMSMMLSHFADSNLVLSLK
jgi:hypothetical protein